MREHDRRVARPHAKALWRVDRQPHPELVENAAEKKNRTENFITRFARYYTPTVTGLALLLAIIRRFLGMGAWSDWILRGLTFLVVSCPCALVISVPLSFFGGIGGASKLGVLVKGSNYLEALAKVDTVVFDKTGTLTNGTFNVVAVHTGLRHRSRLPAELRGACGILFGPSHRAVGQGSIFRQHRPGTHP